MNSSALVWTVIILAFVAANLPFLSNRMLLVRAMAGPKPLALRLLELLLLYGLVGVLALTLEQRIGQVAPQGWEFYAVTACLFLTLAFPGFVYRYLYRRS
jgi:Protein of unknown function (DUF2818)